MHTFAFLVQTDDCIYLIKAFSLEEAELALQLNAIEATFLGVITREQVFSKMKLPYNEIA